MADPVKPGEAKPDAIDPLKAAIKAEHDAMEKLAAATVARQKAEADAAK